ncbi:metallophosphoesterase family protein [Sunxiuqinia dokdonensis]|uniref:Metallophosphatase n=1 Tax=Sunxiuqinia dokdonensis TaxID=1409788 RepID=A0A0L8V795_9BACT|nr:metallophosphoesterase family protein [Sunxiuqinia dokdonensis]KOH44314.1 metallophosphatase [Sunxiuqinia dokdonensis]
MNKRLSFTLLFFLTMTNLIQAQEINLKFRADQSFKIVQFTDAHIKANDPASKAAFATMAAVLDLEQPDLVVYTGDIVTGKPVEKGWNLATALCIERDIPFAVVFGNHDDEDGVSRAQLTELITRMPYSLLQPKVDGVNGYGNYVLEIKSAKSDGNAALLYCMDSNAYSTMEGIEGYGWFHIDQVNWYLEQSQIQQQRHGKILPALAFFHIPLPEYRQAYGNEKNPPIGVRFEDECAPEINTGMYAAMLHAGDVMGTFVGHDHVNDYMAYLNGIALTYGRFTGGKTTYGDLPNGARVIVLKEGKRAFSSWIRLGNGDKLLPVEFPADFLSEE